MSNLAIVEHQGKRVLTTAQLAEAYGTAPKVINRNFQRNTERFQQGIHFFALTGDALREFKGSRQNDSTLKYASVIYLWTEQGAFMSAKSLSTENAWKAYEKLVEGYFKLEQHVKLVDANRQMQKSIDLALINSGVVATLQGEIKEIRLMVEEQITLDHGEQRRINKAVASKVYELTNDKSARPKLFSELYGDIKARFGVASYRDIKRKDMLNAIRYIEAWLPKKVG